MKKNRLEILKNSLEKKEAILNQKFSNHFETVSKANGQPLNDKSNGASTFRKWEKQEDTIRNQLKEIEKTKIAIDKEEDKISGCEMVLRELPQPILDDLQTGKITQWRKFPNRFFVKNGGRGRIIWENNKLLCSYVPEFGTEERKVFADCFNNLAKKIYLFINN